MIHHIFANKTNIGDWLAARGIQRAVAGCAIAEHFCDEPFIDQTLRALSEASADDLVIIGGGGLFMDYFVPFWEAFRSASSRLRYGLWGIGLCDLKLEPSRPPPALITQIVRDSQFCYVRDELTRMYLADCDLPPPSGCPSLLALEPHTNAGCGVLHVDNYTTVGAAAYQAMERIAIQWAKPTGRRVLRTNNRIEARETSLDKTLDLYQKADVILSSALHGCIIGLALGRKVVAVSGDRKIESFMQSVGLSDWVCDQTDVERVTELLTRIEGQPPVERWLSRLRLKQQEIGRRVLLRIVPGPTTLSTAY